SLLRTKKSEGADPLFADPEEEDDEADDRVAQEHLRLYRMLEKMSRDAELVRRETGRHALWLGYPLLHAAAKGSQILAPVFLWPISLLFDRRRQGKVPIGRATDQRAALPPQFNRAMSAWLRRQLDVTLPDLSSAELSGLDLHSVQEKLNAL